MHGLNHYNALLMVRIDPSMPILIAPTIARALSLYPSHYYRGLYITNTYLTWVTWAICWNCKNNNAINGIKCKTIWSLRAQWLNFHNHDGYNNLVFVVQMYEILNESPPSIGILPYYIEIYLFLQKCILPRFRAFRALNCFTNHDQRFLLSYWNICISFYTQFNVIFW